MFICFYVFKRVDISTLVMGGDSDIMEYDRRTPEISNAPLHMKQETLHQYSDIAPSLYNSITL